MNTRRMAEDFIRRAETHLKQCVDALASGDFPTSLRRAQECVELSLKGALRLLGIEYPLAHDVSGPISGLTERTDLPVWFGNALGEMANISKQLSEKRGLAMYGEEQQLTPASELIARQDAEKSRREAELVFKNCRRLIDEAAR